MPRNRLALLLFGGFLLSACDSGQDHPSTVTPPEECSISEQNRYVYEVMQDRYYWDQEIPVVNDLAGFPSPESLLDFIKHDPPDRFSYIADAQTFSSLISDAEYTGLGFSFVVESNSAAVLRFVYADSPAGKAGLQRGDRILEIDGTAVSTIANNNRWANAFGADQAGTLVELLVRHKDATETRYSIEKGTVKINTVLDSRVLQNGSESIAYLAFKSFLSPSFSELDQAFSSFQSAHTAPRKMVVDLRYNGGGLISVARTLAAYLYPNGHNQPMGEVRHNSRYSHENETLFFASPAHSLELDEIIFITTGSTASASEMVINALRPFVDVKLVGSRTNGKPVGMYGRKFCDKNLLAIEFSLFNAVGEGDYFEGLGFDESGADCPANDDLSHNLGNPDEAMLEQALGLLSGQGCLTRRTTNQTSIGPSPSPVLADWGRAW